MGITVQPITNFNNFNRLRFSNARSWHIDEKLNFYFFDQQIKDKLKAIWNSILRKLGLTSLNLTQYSLNKLLNALKQCKEEFSQDELVGISRLLLSSYKYATADQAIILEKYIAQYYRKWAMMSIANTEILFTNSVNGEITTMALKHQIEIDIMRTTIPTEISLSDERHIGRIHNINNFRIATIRKQLVDNIFKTDDLKQLALGICMMQNVFKANNYRIFASCLACPVQIQKIQDWEQSKYKVICAQDNVIIIHEVEFKEYKATTKFVLSLNKLQEINQLLLTGGMISLKLLNEVFIHKELFNVTNCELLVRELQEEYQYYDSMGIFEKMEL